jgi:hypothetical protein
MIAVGAIVAVGALLVTMSAPARPAPGPDTLDPMSPAPAGDGELVEV